jgi:2-(1,2-epoxy-1,2-dihydrophenyl)acetyl-CoA isomerase
VDYETIIFEKEGGVATITMNRPQTLNATNFRMIEEIIHAMSEVAGDDEVRAVVITGAGRGFCSGDDRKGMGPAPGGSMIEGLRQRNHTLIRAIRNLRKPVIAAVNGNAHGMGSDIMLACDFRIASENAKLGDLRTRYAITIGSGGTYMLPRLVGLAKAIELIFTGEMIDAKEAERIGLVNKTVPADRFKAEVMELANKLAQGPTKVIGIAKAEIYRELNMDLAAALEDELMEVYTPTEDSQEGRKSFLEKRPPKYMGR